MSQFKRPAGVCFQFGDELPAVDLSSLLRKITGFLQDLDPHAKLNRFDDWWEHDGLHFEREKVNFTRVFAMVNSPQSMLESTPNDDFVFVGIAPEDISWYLRYRVDWDDAGTAIVGRCELLLSEAAAVDFRQTDFEGLTRYISEIDSESFYARTIL
jgi:hypothetical protein